MKKKGRPQKFTEPTKVVPKRVPMSQVAAFHAYVDKWLDKFRRGKHD